MILRPACGYFDAAHGTALGGDHGPAVFAVHRDFLSVQIPLQFRAVGSELDLALELSAHGHEELVVGLDVVFADLANGHAAGKGHAFVRRKGGGHINRVAVIHGDMARIVIRKGVVEKSKVLIFFMYFLQSNNSC